MQRTHWSDIITQYNALFPKKAPTTGDEVGDATHDVVLHNWISYRISVLVAIVRKSLAAITDGNALAGALEVCMYAGSRLARAGADFRGESHTADVQYRAV